MKETTKTVPLKRKHPHGVNAFLLMVILGIMALGCVGCGGETTEPVVLDLPALGSELQQVLGLEAELSPVDAETFTYLYGISASQFTESYCLVSTGATADEICLLKATDRESYKALKAQLEARVVAQKESFADYLPLEVGKLDRALLLEQDLYLFLVVCDQPETAESTIGAAIAAAGE